MAKKILSLLLIVITASVFYGCGLKKIKQDQLPDYKEKTGYATDNTYVERWSQPTNKVEKCEMSFEGYGPKDRETDRRNTHTHFTWDGECKNGKAEGLGKLILSSAFADVYEIDFVKDGKSQGVFYRAISDRNIAEYGSYEIKDNKIVGSWINRATIKDNGDIDFLYSQAHENNITNVGQGGVIRKHLKGTAVIVGLFGTKLGFAESKYTPNGESNPNAIWWGYMDIVNQRYESYGILKNIHGLFHLRQEKGTVKEEVKLPDSFSNTINNVVADAREQINITSRAGNNALFMKKRYEKLHPTVSIPPKPSLREPEPKPDSGHGIATGTGFFISKNGYLLTNNHVVQGSSKISVLLGGEQIIAKVVSLDPANDIALLKINKRVQALPIEVGKKIKQGSDISVVGFPNIGLQGNNKKATFGYINANSGIRGDIRYFQISAPIQPGNSGSPLLNSEGEVIGIVSSTLNQNAMLEETGTIAQNVNYAIKISYALPMLLTNDVIYKKPLKNNEMSKTRLIDTVKPSIVLVIAE